MSKVSQKENSNKICVKNGNCDLNGNANSNENIFGVKSMTVL